ncbi:hypothetical protein FB45DRAFT_880677 [Roridomyces roridus]|uniref:Uncharacterized protein n=1 Tax=Roridomyces roridus TaxID=1738132 RepID=A0AAD7F8L7_9AGAR|nr:hypothetical protein FB45DRAFT_880677 [Roridomyces roridus]
MSCGKSAGAMEKTGGITAWERVSPSSAHSACHLVLVGIGDPKLENIVGKEGGPCLCLRTQFQKCPNAPFQTSVIFQFRQFVLQANPSLSRSKQSSNTLQRSKLVGGWEDAGSARRRAAACAKGLRSAAEAEAWGCRGEAGRREKTREDERRREKTREDERRREKTREDERRREKTREDEGRRGKKREDEGRREKTREDDRSEAAQPALCLSKGGPKFCRTGASSAPQKALAGHEARALRGAPGPGKQKYKRKSKGAEMNPVFPKGVRFVMRDLPTHSRLSTGVNPTLQVSAKMSCRTVNTAQLPYSILSWVENRMEILRKLEL